MAHCGWSDIAVSPGKVSYFQPIPPVSQVIHDHVYTDKRSSQASPEDVTGQLLNDNLIE
jgi:hypothetical protein